ncbi:MAG: hypothetical protein U0974_13295, partial [Gemmatimonadales bacterium]|nr:hypothetical protein [Gemmatimonadales bacterium]
MACSSASVTVRRASRALVSAEGYETLLDNISKRLGMPAASREDAVAIIDAIDIPADIAAHIAS